MPLAWEHSNIIPVRRSSIVPSHVCGGNPQYSRYYKSCRLCMLRKVSYKLEQPNLNQRSKIKQPCINGFDEFNYVIEFERFLKRAKIDLGVLKI